MRVNNLKTVITIRRLDDQTIEYDVVEGLTYVTKADDPRTLWRADDQEMIQAFKAMYPKADIIL
jgi:hypothetical protein